MRKFSTEAEAFLWFHLKSKGLNNIKFRRQHIFGDYIVDFVDLKSHTIIEVDGGYHFVTEQKEYDNKRTGYLNGLGFSILRFKNEEVLNNISNVLISILNHIQTKV